MAVFSPFFHNMLPAISQIILFNILYSLKILQFTFKLRSNFTIMNKFRQYMYRFMYGRYGADEFSRFLLIASLVAMILHVVLRWRILYYIFMGIIIYNCFRMYSKNIYKRQQELAAFRVLKNKFNSKFALQKRKWNERHTHRFFSCPECRTTVRVPKGRGKIEITCPKCKKSFIKKS